jgi:K+-transporting ATPase ATPase A chain
MLLGEITPGGVGAGLYGMLVFVLLAVFIAGLMVGRTPEYLGKKVETFEMKMSMLVVLVLSASILGFTALAVATPAGRAGPLNAGPHGFSEILYAFASQTANNGSAFGGPAGNTPFYNVAGALAMLVGRFAMIIPILAIAGSLAAKRRVAVSAGTFPTTGVMFVVLLVGVVIIIGALNFLPAMALGPIVEHLFQQAGVVFP